MRTEQGKDPLLELRKNKAKLEKYSRALSGYFADQLLAILPSETDRQSLKLLERSVQKVLQGAIAQVDSEIVYAMLSSLRSEEPAREEQVVELTDDTAAERMNSGQR